jgi:hypothetical protein
MEGFPNICMVCRSMFREMRIIIAESDDEHPGFRKLLEITQEQSYAHHRDFLSLLSSVNEKCYICLRLWARFRDAETSPETPESLAESPGYSCALSSLIPSSSAYLPMYMNVWFSSKEVESSRQPPLHFRAIASRGRHRHHFQCLGI